MLAMMVPELPAREAIRLATAPALSPDGSTLAFPGAATSGWFHPAGVWPGRGTRIPAGTRSRASPPTANGIAFTSDRTGTRQVYVGHVSGGFATQVTFHSEGSSVEEWFPDGQSLLVLGERDHSWCDPQRLFRVTRPQRAAEELLFDAAAEEATISPDGQKILFTREGVSWWRKGYRGSEASQIWLYDVPTGGLTKLVDHDRGGCSPLWQPDGKASTMSAGKAAASSSGSAIWPPAKERHLTEFRRDDSVVMPCISRDGRPSFSTSV